MKSKVMMVCILSTMFVSTLTGCLLRKETKVEEVVYEEPVVEEVTVEEEVVVEEVIEEKEFNYFGLTEDELNLVYAVVMQEGGPTYESATAVMSTIVNRVNNPDKWSWAGDTIIEQITYPMQYCYSLDDYWVKYLDGNVPDEVKWAVQSVLEFGPVNDYDCFRGYYLEDCEQIADNWYFIG